MRSLIIGCLLAMTVAGPAAADNWRLDREVSTLSFGSVKAGSIGETHRFDEFDAEIARDGRFTLSIDLSSVETGIDIRDERMRKFLFEVADYAEARLTGEIEIAAFDTMAIGEVKRVALEGTLALHGEQSPVRARVTVLRLAFDRVAVFPGEVIFVNAADFGLSDGVNKLRELAGLPSIAQAVPVSFNLVFERIE